MMTKTILASTLLSLAACGPKASSGEVTDPCADHKGGTTGPAYGALFTEGASWQLEMTTTDTYYDDEGSGETRTSSTEPVVVTCNVARLTEVEGVKLSEIVCDEPEEVVEALAGAWAMNARGVWRLGEWPGDGVAPELLDDDMEIAAVPVAGTVTGEETEVRVERKGDAWCHSEAYIIGDDSFMSLCVGPDGPTEASWGGGSANHIHEAAFTRKR